MSKRLNENNEQDNSERRSDLYLWESLEQLKDTYADYINPNEIDKIANHTINTGKFKKRQGLSNEENASCFYNLLDALIMEQLEKRYPSLKNQPGSTDSLK